LLAAGLQDQAAPVAIPGQEPAADLDATWSAAPDDEVERSLHLAPVLLGFGDRGLGRSLVGLGDLEPPGKGAVEERAHDGDDPLLELALVHHVPGIEPGVDQVPAEGGLVAPLVGEEAAGGRVLGEHPAYRAGEVDRLPPAVLGDEAQGLELDVL